MADTKDKLGPFIATSVVLHVGLVLTVIFVPGLFPTRGDASWGTSTDNGIKVGVASSLPGIPLPSPPVVQEDVKPNDSDTLNPPEPEPPKPVEKVPEPDAVKVPSGKTTPEKKKPPEPAPKTAKNEVLPPSTAPSNAVPGQGGQIAIPFGGPQAGAGQATFGGDGTFGMRFPEYVVAMTRAIQLVWQENIGGVPPGTPRVYVTFTIDRRGQASNIEVAQSSGSVQLDNSAKRAVLAARLPSLPTAYSGSTIDVRFYFGYTR
jgi:TonB family protein